MQYRFRRQAVENDLVNQELRTLLPYGDFHKSVEVLDTYRVVRQAHEALLVLNALVGGPKHHIGKNADAAMAMWRGYEPALGFYTTMCIRECHARNGKSIHPAPHLFADGYGVNPAYKFHEHMRPLSEIAYPEWLWNEELHASHRALLLRCDIGFYVYKGWLDDKTDDFLWPEPEPAA